MRQLAGLILLLIAVAPAWSQDKPLTVVELFTSQGCNSCPPADAYLEDLVQRDDVLALGFHVDYWDRLGWRDTLGDPSFTARQYGYAGTLQRSGVYTPQAVVDGRSQAIGSDRGTVEALLAEGGRAERPSLELRPGGDGTVQVVVDAADQDDPSLRLTIIRYSRETFVPIERGENAGEAITYVNAVRSVAARPLPTQGETLLLDGPDAGGGLAVLLQAYSPKGAPGPIVAAERFEGAGGG